MTVGAPSQGSGREVTVPGGRPDHLEEKARRYLAEGRVHVWSSSWRGVTADVTGTTGVWHVSGDPKGWSCSCPSTVTCAHILAVALVHDPKEEDLMTERVYAPDDLERPFDIPGQEVLPADGYEEARLTHDTDASLELDVETGELVATPDPERAELDLAAAPVTWRTLTAIADTEMVNATLRGRPYAMYAALLYGRELGIGPIQSLQHVAIIDGSAVLSAELMLSRFRHAGHTLKILRADDKAVALEGKRGDNGDTAEVVYELEDAVAAGLVDLDDKGNPKRRTKTDKPLPWERYTADMLWARAVTRLVRRLAPDVLGRPR